MEKYDGLSDERVRVVYVPNSTVNFIHEEGVDPCTGEKMITRGSDVTILLNEQRLSKLDELTLRRMVESAKQSPELDSFSDSDIMSTIKSRFCQSNADVYNYVHGLDQKLKTQVTNLKEEIELRKAERESAARKKKSEEEAALLAKINQKSLKD